MPVASVDSAHLYKVWEIKTLGRSNDVDARKLLERVAEQVQPIMRKRKWRVTLLSEFCPKNPSLLGLNIGSGQEIRIRLRRFPNDTQLFGYEELLGTMLHELTHIQRHAHNAAFYKLLDELTKECEELMVKGVKGTGQGFDAPGQRLGGISHNPRNLHQAALAAAEKRAKLNALMPVGGQLLGGNNEIMRALTPVQAAAMAAEKRWHDDIWCGAPLTSGEDGFDRARDTEQLVCPQHQDPREAGKGIAKDNCESRGLLQGSSLVEVDGNKKAIEHSVATDAGSSLQNKDFISRPGKSIMREPENAVEGSSLNHERSGRQATKEELWECQTCTLLNPALVLICSACGAPKPKRVKGTGGMWTCKFCTLENNSCLDNCGACEQWRFSHGAPVSAQTHTGT